MKIEDFYIQGVQGKDLSELIERLEILPENFVTLKEKSMTARKEGFTLGVKYSARSSKQNLVEIEVRTSFPEKFTLNLPEDARDFKHTENIACLQTFSAGYGSYSVKNVYDVFCF